MTFKLQAQSGSCRRSMWCGAAEHTGMPSPTEQDQWGACTSLPANASACMRNMDLNQQVSPIGRYGNADSILSGQRSNRGAPYGVSRGQEVARLMARVSPVNMTPHCYRHHGNLCAEKVRPHRPRQNKSAVRREYPDDVGACQQWHSAGVDRQGTLTIIGSNVRLGTEMPVALSLF